MLHILQCTDIYRGSTTHNSYIENVRDYSLCNRIGGNTLWSETSTFIYKRMVTKNAVETIAHNRNVKARMPT